VSAGLSKHSLTSYVDELNDPEHDALIDRLRKSLRIADIMVVLVAGRSSFVDSEVFAASVLKKPVILLMPTTVLTLPNTALIGYPMFDIEKLAADEYKPLADFIYIVANHWRMAIRELRVAGWNAVWVMSIPLIATETVFSLLRFFVSPFKVIAWEKPTATWIYVGASIFALISNISSLRQRFAASSVVRQNVVTGSRGTALLIESLKRLDRDDIAKCLRTEP
jgi:hypothetical protein